MHQNVITTCIQLIFWVRTYGPFQRPLETRWLDRGSSCGNASVRKKAIRRFPFGGWASGFDLRWTYVSKWIPIEEGPETNFYRTWRDLGLCSVPEARDKDQRLAYAPPQPLGISLSSSLAEGARASSGSRYHRLRHGIVKFLRDFYGG